jgi:hypothetical protein
MTGATFIKVKREHGKIAHRSETVRRRLLYSRADRTNGGELPWPG